MFQSYCLNAYAKCDLEWESMQVLEKWCQGRVTHKRKYETNNDKQSLKAQSLAGHLPQSKLAHKQTHARISCKDLWEKSIHI